MRPLPSGRRLRKPKLPVSRRQVNNRFNEIDRLVKELLRKQPSQQPQQSECSNQHQSPHQENECSVQDQSPRQESECDQDQSPHQENECSNQHQSPRQESEGVQDQSPRQDDYQFNFQSNFSQDSDDNSDIEADSGDEDGLRKEWDFSWDSLDDEHCEPIEPELTSEKKLVCDLADWVTACRIPRTHVNKLLILLRKLEGYDFLPKDYRTLLKTVRNVPVKDVDPGLYFHFGIAAGVSRSLVSLFHTINLTQWVEIFVNIDGIPISKSGSSQFWPILGKLVGVKGAKPFVIGVYWGLKKPKNVNIYLENFVEEALQLKNEGFSCGGRQIFVVIVALVCDRPALSFILSVAGNTGFFSCLKCFTRGITYRPDVNKRKNKFTVFPELNSQLRTDSSFRNRTQPQHHLAEVSLLENLLYFNLVDGVILDSMHLTDLGVQKKLLLHYIHGKYLRVKLSKRKIAELAERVEECRLYVPFEFPRKLESLQFVGRWKATSYRMVKLYLGPVLFKNIIRDDLFSHFLLFHTAMKILSDEKKCLKVDNLMFCQQLLVKFVTECIALFGLQFVSSNVHNLIHIVMDVLRFGNLDSYSAYCFENLLQILKNLVRKSDKPLQQLVKRIGEIEINRMVQAEPERMTTGTLTNKHFAGPLINGIVGQQFKNLQLKSTLLAVSMPNNCVILSEDQVVLIENFVRRNSQTLIIGRKFMQNKDFFCQPIPSRNLMYFEVWDLGPLDVWSVEDVTGKAFIMPSFEKPTHEKQISFVVALLLSHDST